MTGKQGNQGSKLRPLIVTSFRGLVRKKQKEGTVVGNEGRLGESFKAVMEVMTLFSLTSG